MSTPRKQEARLTLTVPEAARRLGIGKNQGYEVAKSGEIPTIKIGKRVLVPIAAFEAMLAGARSSQAAAGSK